MTPAPLYSLRMVTTTNCSPSLCVAGLQQVNQLQQLNQVNQLAALQAQAQAAQAQQQQQRSLDPRLQNAAAARASLLTGQSPPILSARPACRDVLPDIC